MFIHGELVILVLALTADGRVHAGEIAGGHEVVPHSRPYMVILERHKHDGKTGHCDGFLVKEDFVMTAAHCQASSYTVLLGVHDFHQKNEIHRAHVEQDFPHKDYDAASLANDIMLLKLRSKVTVSKKVKTIILADQSNNSLPKSCRVSGWGATENSSLMSPTLLEVNVTLIGNEQCPKKHSYCSEGETGPRQGDSGSPLVCEDGKAYGVVSGGSKKSGSMISVFTKIPDYTDWINVTIGHQENM